MYGLKLKLNFSQKIEDADHVVAWNHTWLILNEFSFVDLGSSGVQKQFDQSTINIAYALIFFSNLPLRVAVWVKDVVLFNE